MERPFPLVCATAAAVMATSTFTLPAAAAPAADLMISTYIEGSSNNKAVELHNPTDAPLNISGYSLTLYSNGSDQPTNTENFGDVEIPPGGHFLLVNSQAVAELAERGDATSSAVNYNGDDVLVLRRGDQVIDSMGQLGQRIKWPGMTDRTLTNATCEVDTDPADEYSPANFTESGKDDFSTLGTVDCRAEQPNPQPSNPAPSSPEPSDPQPSDPEPSEPEPSSPEPSDPEPSTPEPSDPEPSDPEPSSPEPSDPEPSSPEPSDTAPGSALKIGAVQGPTDVSPYAGKPVTVEGTVTATYQGDNGFTGFYIQDEGDDDPATSDGIFVYAPGQPTYAEGTRVRVEGSVAEFQQQTQIVAGSRNATITIVETEVAVEPTVVDFPVTDWEPYEGMLVTFPQDMYITEMFQYGRYGELVTATERQYQPTHLMQPGPETDSLSASQETFRLRLDDGRGNQNPSPAIHPNGQEFSQTNTFRAGDVLTNITGVMSYRNNQYKLQPRADWFGAEFRVENPRPEAPAKQGDFRVASFNVLNYFTTFAGQGGRGANDAEEFERQKQKIVNAIAAIDADVVGLVEIENNGTALENLVTALNQHVGEERYQAINTGKIGTDQITTAFIYKTATAEPVGDWAAYDPADQKNRPALTQRFQHKDSGETVSVSINHFKSKGSACNEPDEGQFGVGNCNQTRQRMAEGLANWLESNGYTDDRLIVMGDLNSYAQEDPIRYLESRGFEDQEKRFGGQDAYSYVFDGRLGYLDYAMANGAASADIVNAASWHINADEPTLLDYTMKFKSPREQDLWAADPYRSSDHDPVVVDLGMKTKSPASPSPEPPSSEPSPTATQTETETPAPLPDATKTAAPAPAPTVTETPEPSPTVTATQTAPPAADPSAKGGPSPMNPSAPASDQSAPAPSGSAPAPAPSGSSVPTDGAPAPAPTVTVTAPGQPSDQPKQGQPNSDGKKGNARRPGLPKTGV